MTQDRAIEIVQEEFAKKGTPVSVEHAGYLLWNNTGWPAFFETDDIEKHIREQVVEPMVDEP